VGVFLLGSASQSVGLYIFSDEYVICPNRKVCSVKNKWCATILQLIQAETTSLLIQRFPTVSSFDKIHIVWTQNITHYECGLEDNALYRSANHHRSLLFSEFLNPSQLYTLPLIQCSSVISWASYPFYFIHNLRSPCSLVSISISCGLGSQVSIPGRGSRKTCVIIVLLPALVPTRPYFQSALRAFYGGGGRFKAAQKMTNSHPQVLS
jgi:hypothetical protein